MFRPDLLKGKRILVTGGGSGLGKSMTERFLELGAKVAICGRRGAVLEETAAELAAKTGGKITTHRLDIRDANSVEEMIDAIWADGPLDCLVNNAAGNFISRTEDLSSRGFDAIANIVLHGTFYVTQACGRRWIAEGRPMAAPASVLSIVVTWVFNGSAYVVPSAMAKSGVAAMTRSLAVEWGPKGVRLNAVAPGPFPTEGAGARLSPSGDMKEKGQEAIPMRRVGKHLELANLAAFLLADEVAYINGEVMAIDGGQWLNGAGNFGYLDALTDDDWGQIRERIQKTNAADRAKR